MRPVSGERPQDAEALIAVYQALVARRGTSLDLVWRVPAFVLTAETLIYAGLFVIKPGIATAILGILGVLVAFFGAMTMRRAQLSGKIDSYLLDWYEKELLRGRPQFLLHHSQTFHEQRELLLAEIPEQDGLRLNIFDQLSLFVTTGGSAVIWIGLLVLLGIGAALIAAIR